MYVHAEKPPLREAWKHRCAGLILRGDDALILFRRKNNREFYVLIGGHMHEGETQEETLHREIMEESSLRVSNPKRVMDLLDHYKEKYEHYYLCDYTDGTPELGGEEKIRHSEENFYRLEWIPLSKIPHINLLPLAIREWITETLVNRHTGSG